MKILMVTQKVAPSDPILGFTVAWIRALAGQVEKLVVVTLEHERCELPANVEVYSLGKEQNAGRFTRFLRLFNFANHELSKENFDLIFCHMCPKYVIFLAPWAKALRIPMTLWYAHKQRGLSLNFAVRLVERVFTPTRQSIRVSSNKILVTGHGIDLSKFDFPLKPPAKQQLKIINIGRISEIKDQLTFLRAARHILDNRLLEQPIFYLIGSPMQAKDERYLHELKDFVEQHHLHDNIKFISACPPEKAVEWYREADIIVNTSNTGSLDKVIIEAMAAKRVIITCNDAGIKLLRKVEPLLTFNSGDFMALSDNLVRLSLMDEQKTSELLAGLSQIVSTTHSLKRLAQKLTSEFKRIIKNAE